MKKIMFRERYKSNKAAKVGDKIVCQDAVEITASGYEEMFLDNLDQE